MRTYKRICLKYYEICPGSSLEEGKEYITSPVTNARVTVFTSVWAKVPADLFDEGEVFTEGEESEKLL